MSRPTYLMQPPSSPWVKLHQHLRSTIGGDGYEHEYSRVASALKLGGISFDLSLARETATKRGLQVDEYAYTLTDAGHGSSTEARCLVTVYGHPGG